MMKQTRTAILTIQAARPGGIPTVVDWWHRFLRDWGHDPHTLMATFREDDITRVERITWMLRHWRPHPHPTEPNPTTAVAALPVPLWLLYLTPHFLIGPLLGRFDQIVYAGGPVLGALPLIMRGIPTVLWMGTLYEDEIEGKVIAGDAWATRIRQSRFWPLIVQQERYVLRHATRVVAQSPHTLKRVRDVAPNADAHLALVPMPLMTDALPPLIAGPYILNVSRINDPRKNISLLLRAFAETATAHQLVLVGDDPQPALRAQVADLGLADRVRFMGKVSDADLHALFAHADLFVMSSTQEGLGIVVIEAMAHGTPVLATRCGGPEGIVQDALNGRMVPNDDQAAMTAALRDLLNDPAHLAELSRGAVAYIRQNAAPEVVSRHLRPHVEAIMSQPPTRPLMGWLAAGWALLILIAYMVHQLRLVWPSIREALL